jgi:hypothetical protein
MYETNKILGSLKMPYEKIHACPKGCMLFRNEHADTKYCIYCKSSRYFEVDKGEGKKEQLNVPVSVLRYLSFIQRLQQLFMNEESAQQMRWAKEGKRYNPKKIHSSCAAACTNFIELHKDIKWVMRRM